MNLAILTGNLGRDPELRTSNSGESILNFSIGVQTGTKDKPATMWANCALWGKRAVTLQPYLAKGDRVTVSGSIRLEDWVDKNGVTKQQLKMSVDQIDLPPKGERSAADPAAQAKPAAGKSTELNTLDDDIPF